MDAIVLLGSGHKGQKEIFESIFSKEIFVYLIFMLLKGQNHEKDPANKLDVHKSCIVKVREDLPKKECLLSGIARIRGGGPCPKVLALFSPSTYP